MKWREEGSYLAVSDCGYRVAKFHIGKETIYRASIKGDFIGEPKSSFEESKSICDNHLQIMGREGE